MYEYGHIMGCGIGVGFLSIIFWILLIALAVRLLRGGRHLSGWDSWGGRGNQPNMNALTILNERYARGEINKEEYEAKKKDLLS